MELIKQFIITVVTTIIFITAVELISPGKSMKKYIQYVLGLILVSVMLNPIVYLFTKGENEIISTIKKYEDNFNENIPKEGTDEMLENREVAFNENLNRNCEKKLEEEFSGKSFKSDIECNFDFDKMTYDIEKVSVGVKDGNVKLIEKININIRDSKETISEEDEVESQEEIINYVADLLKIPKEKIEVYSLEG